ncbi:16S rRNA (guanine(527)-N(7))-methyltransferase RsmG [Candidatus Gracilibacteria bacterium]|nr:16S rRNA (guanine(527)-N(7))-methyltransferase RsmG [Candidatus Gracilibacteria bacterium]
MQSLFSSHGFELSDSELAQFEQFLTLFMEYNAHTNLSAIRDREGIIEKHFVDSLYGVSIINEVIRFFHHTYKGRIQSSGLQDPSGAQDLKKVRLLDIGSGGGFPGIPLKIVIPELDITLLDSVGKKVKAMNHFIENLGLTDIQAIQDRAESLAKNPDHKGKYDIVVSRATAYITDILFWSAPFLTKTGRIILYKMPGEDERRDIGQACQKYRLKLTGELEYELAGKARIVYVFARI